MMRSSSIVFSLFLTLVIASGCTQDTRRRFVDAGRPLPDVPSRIDVPPSVGDDRVVITPEGLLGIGLGLEVEGICDDGFGANEAAVACRSVGMNYVSHEVSQTGPSSTFYMDDVMCSGAEASLFDCEYSTSHNCGQSEWIRLLCN